MNFYAYVSGCALAGVSLCTSGGGSEKAPRACKRSFSHCRVPDILPHSGLSWGSNDFPAVLDEQKDGGGKKKKKAKLQL